jgi:3-hydroxybutyryl-CoA dehydrogenase
MGAGIAHAFLLAGSAVSVVERDAEQADTARDRVRRSLAESVERGTTHDSFEHLSGRLAVGTDDAVFGSAELVIEAVPEDQALKMAALRRIEDRLDGSAVMASNTSSLSIGELSAVLRRPERFLGLHFFNPVPASALVEVVVGARTSAGTVVRAQNWVESLGKTAVTVSDSPGFASSRLGVALGLEAIRMLEESVASADDIDAAMVLGYKHPIGPLRLTDLVGLDVRLAIAEHLHAELGERFAPPRLLREKVDAGDLGRKSGRGFFEWPGGHA